MAYQVLARKWRPQTFEEVVGQDPVTRTLKNAVAQGRVAHAFLFSGPRGVGKTSVARILAKALNCAEGPTPSPCNRCQACTEITLGSSLDVLEIDGASNRGIDEVRDLREKIKYLPVQGHFKVYIIDEVHMLTKEAFNALLKTLEEPPPHAVFILATTEQHKVPVTILSRCQRYDFRRIPTDLLQQHLENLVSREGWSLDPEGLALVAREAEGSLRDAQGFLDQVVTFGGQDVSVAEVARILGVTDRRALMSALGFVVRRQGPEMLGLVEELYNQGHDLKRFYQDLVHYARHLLLAAMHPEARQLAEVADSEWEELTTLARERPAPHFHNLLSLLLTGEEELKRTALPRLALEVLLLRLIALEPLVPVKDWLGRLEALERRLGGAAVSQPPTAPQPGASLPATAIPPPPPAAQEPAPLPAAPPNPERWPEFVAFVQKKEGGPIAAKLAAATLTGVQEHTLHLKAPKSFTLGGARQQQRLSELVRTFFGPQATLQVEILEPSQEPPPAGPAPLERQALKQQALEIFGGRWLEAGTDKEEPA
jgi:DNA polymerase-3 subunit gamma/tau